MLAHLLLAAALIGSPAQQSATTAGRTVVANGDTVLLPPGTNARVLSRRKAEIRMAATPDRREVVVVVDEQKGTTPPDGLVDRASRYGMANEFPPQYLYQGEAILEEVYEITDGRLTYPRLTTYVTPLGRLRFGSPNESSRADDIVFNHTSSQSSDLGTRSAGSRGFEEVLSQWLNHLENARVEASLTMSVDGVPAARRPPAPGPSASTRVLVSSAPSREGATPAEVLAQVSPGYTADAFRSGVEGTVVLELTVTPLGSVSNARIIRSLDAGLDQEAIRAAMKWRFRPEVQDGRAVTSTVTAEMIFALKPRDR